MKYVKLGKTGLSVSRICFGCMSYGSKSWMPWVIEADEARAHYARAFEAGINFFDTSNNYSIGKANGSPAAIWARWDDGTSWSSPPRCSVRWVRGPTRAGSAASTSSGHARSRCAGSAWITSICIKSIDGTSPHRSKRPSTRSTRWCAPARSATWAPAAWRPGNSPRLCTWRARSDGIASFRCRTTTTCSIARKNAR